MKLLKTISAFANTQPEKIALNDCSGMTVTYSQLMNLSGRVYHYLKKLGIGREDMVNIILPRGVDPFIAMIGIWRAGAACVILEDDYPAERVKYIQNDCGCRLIMDQMVWREAMSSEPLDGWENVDDHDAAFAVYTSGSTGNPKGVLHEYGNVDRAADIDLTMKNHALISPLNFVAAIIVSTFVLHDGGTLFVIPYSIAKDPSAVRECFVRYGIDQITVAPSIFHLFRDIPSLELIAVASEPAYGIWSDNPKLNVYNFYGMSESACVLLYKKLDQPNEIAPIGQPCPGIVVTLRDEEGNPVPDGMEGELCFVNPYVRGYIGLQEQTERTFLNGETRTGDLAKRLENGDYVVLGRIDDMVKINGNRVEPAEVEAAVRKVTGLKEVMARGFSEDNAAYVCLYYTDDVKIDISEVREMLQKQLPYYMIPSHIIHLEAFPRTQTGKLSRHMLPRPVFESSDTEYSAPESPVEKALCDSMAAVLNLDRVSAEADFYALGGSSVTSIKLVSLCPLRRLDIGMIFQGRTPRKIAKIYQETIQALDAVNFREVDPEKPCPLTQTQLGIYAECARHQGEAIYNNPLLWRFPADMDTDRLKNAVETAVKAHPGLFAKIVLDESGLPAMIYRPDWAEGTLCEITDSTEASFALRKPNLVEPFNIYEDRLFRMEIIRTEMAVYLFMDFHHIVFDGTSGHILFDDIASAWRGEKAEPEAYTAWHAATDEDLLRKSDAYESAKSWYLKQFGDIEAPTLPEGDNHGEQPVYATKTIPLKTPVSILRKFCSEHDMTENVLTTAAFGVLLSRYTREKSPVFTTVYNGRKDSRVAHTISMFVKTLPLCFNTTGDISVTEQCAAVKEQLLGDMAGDIFSFAEVAAATGITSDVMFVWQDEIRSLPRLDGVMVEEETVPYNAAGTMLSMELMADGDQLTTHMEYHANRYSECFIADFCNRYDLVLDQMMRRDKISEISLVSDEEVSSLLQLSRGEVMDYDKKETWLDLFRKQVQTSPERVAVTDSESSYTYAELDHASNAVAAWLINQGVTENSFVALRMGRVKEFLAAAIGIHKAGAAYVPIDADYPEDRVNYMLEDSRASLLVTGETVMQALQDHVNAQCVLRATPDTLAYMIYTSGSTGRPKGVMIPHRALTNFVHFITSRWGLTENSRIACHSNFAFDASVEDLYPVLTVGGELFIVPEEARRDIEEMRRYLKENAINGGCYSTQFGQLLAAEEPLDVDYLCLGGEAMTSVPRTKGPVYNTYGPTEFTVDATYFELRKGEAYDVIPIGRPLFNCYAFICDANGHLLPKGMAGELCLAGPQIAEGYRNRPDLTEKAFVDCAFLPGKKMYRTGDLARWNPEDQLEYLGRIDNQVKLRGFRIEMGEIESRAGQYEGIGTVAAQVRSDTLVLYYTAERVIDTDMLRAFLSETLTEYMVPAIYMQLKKMPMTPNGKIDRKALPEPEFSAREYVEPANDVEQTIAVAMQKILKMKSAPGALDSFFELGGDSIKAIRLSSLLRDQDQVISVADIMRHKTVRGIAGAAQSMKGPEISQQPFEGEVEETPIVAFFRDLHLPKPWHYDQTQLFILRDSVTPDLMQNIFNALTYQHDMLRAVWVEDRLVVRPADTVVMIEEYNAASEEEITVICRDIQSHIRMEEALVRAALIHTLQADYFYIACHHLVIDGVSWRIITSDLETAYAQRISGKEINLPQKTQTYADYARVIRKYLNSYRLTQEIPYWNDVQKKLEKLPMSDGRDYSREFARLTVTMSVEDTERFIRTNFDAFGLTLNDALMTAVCRSYSDIRGDMPVSVQLEGHGREELDEPLYTDRTVGWFTSIYPVVFEGMTGDMRRDLMMVKETLHRIPNKGVGYNVLRYVGGEDTLDLHTDKIPPVGFNYLGEMDEGSSEEDMQFRSAHIDTGNDISQQNTEGPGLNINCLTRDRVFTLTIDYDLADYDPEQAGRIAERILEEMRQIIEYISTTDVSMTTASDLGETEWSEKEFEEITAEFENRGERVERIYPLLPMQESMLLKHLQEPESWAYRLVDIFEMDWVPTQTQLRHVLDRLGSKHEVLRTAILHKNVSVPRQAIIDRELGLAMVDFTSEADVKTALKRLREDILTHDFDLQDKPLFSLICAKDSNSHCYVILAQHHIITDGWCTAICMGDLTSYLQEEMTGQFTEDQQPVKGNYEAAVREILQKDMKAGLDYWRELLSDYETRAEISSFGTVPENERSGEDMMTIILDAEKTVRLEQLCRQEGATLSNAVELAWGMVLGACSRTQDAVFGKVVSGRDNTETKIDDLVGLFINSVPVRVKWDDHTSARDALRALNQQAAQSNAYDYCPLSAIQQQTDLGSELLQSILAFENFSSGRDESGEVTILKPMQIREENFGAVNPVSFVKDGQLTFCISFDTRLYRCEEIRRVLSMIRILLEGMIRNPDRELTTLDLLDDDDTRDIIARSKGKTLEYDIHETWLDMFGKWVKECPDHVAVQDSESYYTYGELNRASNAVAAWLINQGVTENSFVAIRMGRVKEFMAAAAGIHKAGAAYVPVDPDYPEDRISFMLEDSEANVTLNAETVREIVAIGENTQEICLAKPENRAYMIYTSGSTGRPKGVVQPHSSLRAMLAWLVTITGDNAVNAHHPSFSFDASVNDLFAPLAAGGQVHILADGMRKDLAGMNRYFCEHKVTGLSMSTQIGMTMINQFPDMPIRYIIMGGEKMLPCEKTDIQLINGYGPTEFTVCSSYHKVNQDKDINIPIGRPVPNTWSLICDGHGRLLPMGMVGELCLAGPQIAEGYWKRPELTEKAFVRCPWLPGEKMYRTGDLARYNENDELEYLGRIDNQVKLRGFRIELGEIENRASQYEGMGTVTAQVRKDTLVLYYTSEKEIDQDTLRAFLAETLTEYMVPEVYIRLEIMPMTPNGKINQKALPEPDVNDRKAPYVPPRNPAERKLCEAFEEVLGMDAETFSIYDDFFALGGNSIRCMRAVSIANISQLSISDIYRLKTPVRISESLSGMEDEDISEQQAREMSVAATPGQLNMMDYQFTHAKSVMYNIPSLYRIDDDIEDDRIETAVNAVIRNHPALCTVFEPDEEHNFVQHYRPDLLSPVQWEDISPENLHSTIDGLIKPFTDYRKPLFRIRLLRCGLLRYLFMDMHHMISDGFSVGVLRENIMLAIKGEKLPEDYYYTFLLREQKAALTNEYTEAKQYFRNLLGDTEWCNIPKPDFVSWDSDGAEELIGLSLTMEQMNKAEERLKVSGNVICLAAGAMAMREYSNKDDVMLNWINDNRSRSGNESTVGLLFKILPVALHMDEYSDVKTLVEEIQRQTDAGFAHSICDYQEIMEKALEDSIEINYLPGLADKEPGVDETGFLEEVRLDEGHSAAGGRVGMYIGEMDGILSVSCSYQKRIYAPGNMRRFLVMFRKHLRDIVLVP